MIWIINFKKKTEIIKAETKCKPIQVTSSGPIPFLETAMPKDSPAITKHFTIWVQTIEAGKIKKRNTNINANRRAQCRGIEVCIFQPIWGCRQRFGDGAGNGEAAEGAETAVGEEKDLIK